MNQELLIRLGAFDGLDAGLREFRRLGEAIQQKTSKHGNKKRNSSDDELLSVGEHVSQLFTWEE